MPLHSPRVGTYLWTAANSRTGSSTEVVSVIPARGGWQITVDRAGNGGQLEVEMRADGLYITAQTVIAGVERRPCTLASPYIFLPNPPTLGRTWTLRELCPSGDVAHDVSNITGTGSVVGYQTLNVGGRSVAAVKLRFAATEVTGATVIRITTEQYVAYALGLPVRTINDSSVGDHDDAVLTEYPSND